MSTQLATQQYRLEQWTAIIQRRNESGMNIKDFCKQHDLSESAYYYWLRKVRAAAIQEQQPAFVELSAPEEAAPIDQSASALIIELGPSRVLVGNNCSRTTLSMVMEVLANA